RTPFSRSDQLASRRPSFAISEGIYRSLFRCSQNGSAARSELPLSPGGGLELSRCRGVVPTTDNEARQGHHDRRSSSAARGPKPSLKDPSDPPSAQPRQPLAFVHLRPFLSTQRERSGTPSGRIEMPLALDS